MYYDRDYNLGSASGIWLSARRQALVDQLSSVTVDNQCGNLEHEEDNAELEKEEREASDHLWYEEEASKREAIAEEVRADAGISKFTVAESLRVTWFVAQRADPALFELCKNPEEGKGFRLASDGLLEKCVIL